MEGYKKIEGGLERERERTCPHPYLLMAQKVKTPTTKFS